MDIRCVVCGEPWDAYGVNHGDMLPWEAKLFRQGAGCPSCEGVPNGYAPERLSDVENGDEDPMLRILAREAHENGRAPKWERPEDPVVWTCDGCGVQVIRDVDSNELEYRAPSKSLASYRHSWWNREPSETPEHTFEDGTCVCEDCYHTCDHCGEPIPPSEYGGSGGYYLQSLDTEVCGEDCLSAVEDEEAQRVWRDCYDTEERIEYIRKNWRDFSFHSFADLLGCVRGKYFCGCASELLG